VAFALAAFALVIGGVSVVAFFARGPEAMRGASAGGEGERLLPSASASASVSVSGGGTASPSAVEEPVASAPPEIDLDDAGKVQARSIKGRAGRPAPPPRGPHITSQPRY